MRSLVWKSILMLSLMFFIPHRVASAGELYAFAEDMRSQFVELWMPENGNVKIKVSNGRKLKPMWLLVKADFYQGDRVVHTAYYGVYCPSPGFGKGEENWFTFPGVSGVISKVAMSTYRQDSWDVPEAGWVPELTVTIPFAKMFEDQQAPPRGGRLTPGDRPI